MGTRRTHRPAHGRRLGCRFADRVIVISEVIRNLIADNCGRTEDVELIPNGVPEPQPVELPDYFAQLGIKPGKFILGMCRFVPEKNLHHLVEACSRIDMKGHRLVLAGDTEFPDAYSRSLKAAAERNGVVLTGFIKGDKLHSLLTACRCFCLPSSHEGLPIALLEAMSYGAPVMVSDIPANLEVGLDPQCYFPCGDIDALASRLQQMVDTPPPTPHLRHEPLRLGQHRHPHRRPLHHPPQRVNQLLHITSYQTNFKSYPFNPSQHYKSYLTSTWVRRKKTIIILLDTEISKGWGFTSALQESYVVDCINNISNTPEYHKGLGNFRRQLSYLSLAIKAIFCCKRYDAVVAWQQFFGIYMGAIIRFLHLKIKCPIIIMTFIYKPRDGFKGKLYRQFVKYALGAKLVKRVTVYSQSEVNHYSQLLGLPQERFTALHLGIDDTPVETTKGDFIFFHGTVAT